MVSMSMGQGPNSVYFFFISIVCTPRYNIGIEIISVYLIISASIRNNSYNTLHLAWLGYTILFSTTTTIIINSILTSKNITNIYTYFKIAQMTNKKVIILSSCENKIYYSTVFRNKTYLPFKTV